MEIGWIDFSKEDREKVLDVINLLQEQGAVDELGIGQIRDAFANRFFPGTSTVQTRAKYFLLVPYILREATAGLYGNQLSSILKRIDQEEKDCALRLFNRCKEHDINPVGIGIIGARVLPGGGWVARKPSSIYWNGIQTYGICRQPGVSIHDLIRGSIYQRNREKSLELGNRNDEKPERERDDADAGKDEAIRFFDLPECAYGPWREGLGIRLTDEEASFLKYRIESSVPHSLFGFVLRNEIDLTKYTSFEAMTADLSDSVPKDTAHLMKLACDFNCLVYLARIRYNLILSDGKNEEARSEWERLRQELPKQCQADLEDIFSSLHIGNFKLRCFLFGLKDHLLSGDEAAVDALIVGREIELKTKSRAKLCHREDYPPEKWVGGKMLDYRLFNASQIASDIRGGRAANVSDKQ